MEQLKKKRYLFIAVIVVCILAIAVIGIGYLFHWSWIGLNGGYQKITITTPCDKIKTGPCHGVPGATRAEEQPPAKTLWDWLQLVIIPLVLAGIGLWFTQVQKSNELTIANDNQREKALQDYIDKMSELLLENHLRESAKEEKSELPIKPTIPTQDIRYTYGQ